ncbi:MAG: hypothetical protein FWB75_04860, partial [Oscillospiraceae bacterium]|nr:hypothetical protein [Oscillospiraceae bacterium]
MSLPPIDGNRPAYHINPAHEYDPNIPIILDADFVEASKDVNPRLERIINNVEILRHAIEKLRSILRAMLGLDIIGIVPNHESLPDPADFPIDALFLVLVDETNDSASTVYRRTVNNTWVRVRTVEVNPDEFVRIENFTRYIQQLQSSLNTLGTYVHEVSTTADEAVRLANQAQRTANEREPLQTTATQAEIDAGTSVAVRRFTPALLARAARNTLLTGFALGANSTVVAGDRIIQAIGKLQAQINNLSAAVGSAPAFSDAIIDAGTDGVQRSPTAANLARAARNTLLTGFSLGTNAAVVAGDRIIGAIGKLQAQINAREPAQTTATN